MLLMAVLGTVLVWSYAPGAALHSMQRGQAYQISPKPCWVDGIEGTCMFVWECIKSEGYHIGMCVDTFMFGSCCAHNATENVILHSGQPSSDQPSLLYTDPSQISSLSHHHHQHQHNNHNGPGSTSRRSTTTLRPKPTSTRPHHHLQYDVNSAASQTPAHTNVILPSSSPSSSASLPSAFSSTSLKMKPIVKETTLRPSSPSPSSSSLPSKFSLKPMSTDGNTLLSSNVLVAGQTKPASWYTSSSSSTEPGFITSNNNNHHDSNNAINNLILNARPSTASLLHQTNGGVLTTEEPGFVTRTKTKPSSSTNYKPKTKPTKKPVPSTTFKSTIKFVTKTTTTARPKSPPTKSPPTHNRPMAPTVATGKLSTPRPDTTLTSTFSTVSASSADSMGCGLAQLHSEPQMRIVGGKDASFGRWPWQVSVRRTSFFGFSSTHRCGGAILNENWIATAGHCVDDLLTSQIRIRVGEYDFSNVREEMPYVEHGVARKIVHPKYNFFTYEYDLALVQLDKPLEFAPHIAPICLPASDDLLIGENATVTGWGRLSEGGTLPSVLQEVQVPIVSNDRCKSMFLRAGRHEFIPEIFLCAGHENGGQDSCQGDSGGPLQVRGKDGRFFLAGIISWGIGCAEANLPGVCTRISKFVPWILKNVV